MCMGAREVGITDLESVERNLLWDLGLMEVSGFPFLCLFPALLGVPAAQVHKYGGLACVDDEAIQELLGSVLPKKETALPLAEKGLAQECLQLPLDLGLSGSEQEEADPSPAISVPPVAEKGPLSEDTRPLCVVPATG